MPIKAQRYILIIFCAIISLMIPLSYAVRVRKAINSGQGDFHYLYATGQIVGTGNADNLYDAATQSKVTSKLYDTELTKSEVSNVHGPVEAIFFVPFAALPYVQAVWLWWGLNISLAYASLYLLLPLIPKVRVEWTLLSLGTFFPLLLTEITGQDTILSLFILSIWIRGLARGRFWMVGSTLALLLYKPNLALPLIVMIVLTSPEPLPIMVGFVVTCLLLSLASVSILGPSAILAYPHALLHFVGSKAEVFVPDMANARGLINWFLESQLSKPTIFLLTVAVSILIMTAAIWSIRVNKNKQNLGFALSIITTILVGYHNNTYDLTLLLLPLLLVWNWTNEHTDTLPSKLLKFYVPVLFCSSILIYFRPQIYTCAVVLFFVLICWELQIREGSRYYHWRRLPLSRISQ